MTSLHRVLVVEDHEPFRRALCELLQQRADVLIVGEAADGLDAVYQAAALRPDVVTIDISLPSLNGIEVARRIRAAVPDVKLMFVTTESSLEVVEQAFSSGAYGYVYKPRTQRDVLPVLEAVIRGSRFVAGSLERIAQGDSLASHHHHVLFCSTDRVLITALSQFIAGALGDDNAVIVLVTDTHQQSLQHSLQTSQVDLALAFRQKRYIPLNINELLAKVMVNGWPDPTRFTTAAEDLLAEAAHAAGRRGRVAACGECAPTLWAQGHLEAATQLEHLWDQIAKSHGVDILCTYPLTAREQSRRAIRNLCAKHTAVEIS